MLDGLKPYPAYKESGVPCLGRIPEHWEVKAVRRMCRVFAGATPSRAVPEFWTSGSIPWLSSGDVNRRRLYSARQFITQKGFAASSTKWIQPGSVVVALAGQGRTKGMVATVEFPTTCNQSLAAVEPSRGSCDHRFLAYYLEARYLDIRSLVGDGLRDGLNLEHVKSIRVPFPPIADQSAIVVFLEHADREIRRSVRARMKLIKLLGEQKAAIIDHTVKRGLSSSDSLKHSGIDWIGEIPEHWGVARLRSLASRITSGSRGWSNYAADTGALFIRIGNLTRTSVDLDLEETVRLSLPASVLGEAARTRVAPGDVLLSITAFIGSVAVVPPALEEAYVSQHVACCRLLPGVANPRWVAYVLLSPIGQTHGILSMYGGTKQGLSLDDVKNYVLVLPPPAEQDELVHRIDALLAQIDSGIASAKREVELIRELRTRLVADVVTGRLDVREAAMSLPEVVQFDDELDFDQGMEGESPDEVADDSASAEADA